MKSFKEKLDSNDTIICAGGYGIELQRRGYCSAGSFVPHVILERPDIIKSIHEEFAHAGSDILIALQYNVSRHKMAKLNMLESYEKLHRAALQSCHQVAQDTGTFAAGSLSSIWKLKEDSTKIDEISIQEASETFREQVVWAQEYGVNLFVCETFRHYKEASLALKAVNDYAPGVPCVVMLVPHNFTETRDGIPFSEAFTRLSNEGAAVVGLNCAMGPETMIEVLTDIKKTYKGPLAAMPNPYRTTHAEPTWLTLRDPKSGEVAYPDNLDAVACGCSDIETFGRQAKALGVQYVGLCCGNSARYTRALAQGLGHAVPADRFGTDNTDSPFEKERAAALSTGKKQY